MVMGENILKTKVVMMAILLMVTIFLKILTWKDDGCSAECKVENGFTCTGEPSLCKRKFSIQITNF